MGHVHFLNHSGSCKKAEKEAAAEVKSQVLEEFGEAKDFWVASIGRLLSNMEIGALLATD